jgi:hypothetical protein
MALLSFVESAPRAYRLKVGNADLFRNSTEPGTSPNVVHIWVATLNAPLSRGIEIISHVDAYAA